MTETNGFGETTAGPVSTQITVSAGNQPEITFQTLKSGNTARNVYLGLPSGASTGPFYLYATGQTGSTYTLAVAAPANSYAIKPPSVNTTGLTYTDSNGNVQFKALELLRSAKDGNFEDAYRFGAKVVAAFNEGDPDSFSSTIEKFRKAHVVFAMLSTLYSEMGTLIDANPGTLHFGTTGIGLADQLPLVAMKPPKHLFRRGRPSEDHEPIDVGPEPSGPRPAAGDPFDPAAHIVQVPVAAYVELDTDHCLRGLERLGVRVDRSKGSSAIDIARNLRATDAIRMGFESVLFIDSDMLFDPADAIRLLRSREPVIGGIYPAKKLGNGQMNCDWADGIGAVRIGPWADRLYPMRKLAGGFLRIKVSALKQIVRELKLPYCRMAERFAWPFFQPVVVEEDGETRYLGEDYSFSWRCHQAGITPMADTSFRLYHIGGYPYGAEEASGQYIERSARVEYHPTRPGRGDPELAVPPEID